MRYVNNDKKIIGSIFVPLSLIIMSIIFTHTSYSPSDLKLGYDNQAADDKHNYKHIRTYYSYSTPL